MFPGTTSKISESVVASAATIQAKSDLVRVTGSTQVNTIVPAFGGFSGVIWLVPTDGTLVLGTSGNILIGITAAQNRAVCLVFSKLAAKWHIDNGV